MSFGFDAVKSETICGATLDTTAAQDVSHLGFLASSPHCRFAWHNLMFETLRKKRTHVPSGRHNPSPPKPPANLTGHRKPAAIMTKWPASRGRPQNAKYKYAPPKPTWNGHFKFNCNYLPILPGNFVTLYYESGWYYQYYYVPASAMLQFMLPNGFVTTDYTFIRQFLIDWTPSRIYKVLGPWYDSLHSTDPGVRQIQLSWL